jgi:hypothetical protein
VRKVKHWMLAVALACTLASSANAQQKSQAVSQPDNGPSLEVTMNFIRNKLNEQNPLDFTVSSGSADVSPYHVHSENEYSTDTNTCSLKKHSKQTSANIEAYPTIIINLKDIKNIKVESLSASTTDYMVYNDETPSSDVTASPDLPTIFLLLKKPFAMESEPSSFREIPPQQLRRMNSILRIIFLDEDSARRVAKAINHAAELCGAGGSDDEPF